MKEDRLLINYTKIPRQYKIILIVSTGEVFWKTIPPEYHLKIDRLHLPSSGEGIWKYSSIV
jgi:hypothetical protein